MNANPVLEPRGSVFELKLYPLPHANDPSPFQVEPDPVVFSADLGDLSLKLIALIIDGGSSDEGVAMMYVGGSPNLLLDSTRPNFSHFRRSSETYAGLRAYPYLMKACPPRVEIFSKSKDVSVSVIVDDLRDLRNALPTDAARF
jgi:hypothetical protein